MFSKLRFDYMNETYVLNTNGRVFEVQKYWSDRSFSREALIILVGWDYVVYNDLSLEDEDGCDIDKYPTLLQALIQTVSFPTRFDDLDPNIASKLEDAIFALMKEMKNRNII